MNTTKTKSKTCLQRTKSTYLHLAFCDPSNDKAQFLNPYLPLPGTSSCWPKPPGRLNEKHRFLDPQARPAGLRTCKNGDQSPEIHSQNCTWLTQTQQHDAGSTTTSWEALSTPRKKSMWIKTCWRAAAQERATAPVVQPSRREQGIQMPERGEEEMPSTTQNSQFRPIPFSLWFGKR